MKFVYLLMASLALVVLSGVASAEVSFKVGGGEYKNKVTTTSFVLDLNTLSAKKQSLFYFAAQVNSVNTDYTLHDVDELLLGAGIVVNDGLYAQLLFGTDTYSGSLKTKLFFPGNNHSLYGLATLNHRNLYHGGLKRTQASTGIGWQFSEALAVEAVYKTGNFHSDFVSDQIMLGLTWSH